MQQRYVWLWVSLVAIFITATIIWKAQEFYNLASSQLTTKLATEIKTPEKLGQKTAPLPKNPTAITETVPILMFHYIRDYTNPADPLGIGLSVSPARFEEDLAILKAAGYQTISLDDFFHHRLKTKSIILTFDDGYDDHFTEALPALTRQGMTGTFFIVHAFIGTTNYMTADQIAQLKAAGMEIADHTVRHRDLAILPYDTAYHEILGGEIGTSSEVFAYPSGEYNSATLSILQQLGIKVAVTTKLGIATNLSPLLELPRIRVKQQTDILQVINEQLLLLKKPITKPVTSQISQ